MVPALASVRWRVLHPGIQGPDTTSFPIVKAAAQVELVCKLLQGEVGTTRTPCECDSLNLKARMLRERRTSRSPRVEMAPRLCLPNNQGASKLEVLMENLQPTWPVLFCQQLATLYSFLGLTSAPSRSSAAPSTHRSLAAGCQSVAHPDAAGSPAYDLPCLAHCDGHHTWHC